jgi:hypothetical protein
VLTSNGFLLNLFYALNAHSKWVTTEKSRFAIMEKAGRNLTVENINIKTPKQFFG